MRYMIKWRAPYGRKGEVEVYTTDLAGTLTKVRLKIRDGKELGKFKLRTDKIQFTEVRRVA